MKKLIIFEVILIIILSFSFISFSEATERKQPGVKYTDTLKQKRADKATSSGRVTPKQPGVNYNDTRRQTENNLSGSNNKIPGQSYDSTLKGTAEGKDRDNDRKSSFNVKTLGNIQAPEFKNRLKEKFNITVNTDDAFIDPITGDVIKLSDLNLAKKQINEAINNAIALGTTKKEMTEMFVENILSGSLDSDFQEIMEEYDFEMTEEIIDGIVFISNYIGIPVKTSHFQRFLDLKKQTPKIENKDIEKKETKENSIVKDKNEFYKQKYKLDKNDDIYLVNFFASWCWFCNEEHNQLIKIKNKNIKIIGVAYKDDKESVEKWLNENENPYDLIVIDDGEIGEDMGLIGIPETHIFKSNLTDNVIQGLISSELLSKLN